MSDAQSSHHTRKYPKFRNDHAAPEVRIGVKEFNCVGVSPPQDHPHVYLNMGRQDTILCPYCATLFRFDPRLEPSEANPQDCVYADPLASHLPFSGAHPTKAGRTP
jgi:uncharacterized Zn-finger protein